MRPIIVLEGDDAFLAACARANEAEAGKLAAAEPSVVERIQSRNRGLLADFGGAGNTAAVRLMLDLGFDPRAARIKPNFVAGETALHVTAAHGRQPAVELLIERGAPLEAKRHGWLDPTAGGLPLFGAAIGMDAKRVHTAHRREVLANAGASVEEVGLTTLTAAVCLGHSETSLGSR